MTQRLRLLSAFLVCLSVIVFNAVAFKNEPVTHALTDRFYRAMVLHAAAEKCGFHSNKPVFASWMAPVPITSPEMIKRLNELILDGYVPLLEEVSEGDCREWRRIMFPRDAVPAQTRFDVVAVRKGTVGNENAA